jgi:hypothetical protein
VVTGEGCTKLARSVIGLLEWGRVETSSGQVTEEDKVTRISVVGVREFFRPRFDDLTHLTTMRFEGSMHD